MAILPDGQDLLLHMRNNDIDKLARDIARAMTEEDHQKLERLMDLMLAYDKSTDEVNKQRMTEEIRQIKTELLKLLPQFKGIDCMVSGDKDEDKANVVVCSLATPDAFRVTGTVDVPCSKCNRLVVLSPDSPKGPPKMCIDCAIAYTEAMKNEDGQESLGA